MNLLHIVGAIIRKDLVEFGRDRLYMMLSILGLATFIVIFWVLPSTVDETIEVGVYAPGMEAGLAMLEQEQADGLSFVVYASAEELRAAVDGRDQDQDHKRVSIGILFPPDFLGAVDGGRSSTVTLLVDRAVPSGTSAAVSAYIREIAFTVAGDQLPAVDLSQQTIVLGDDRAGNQIPFRDRLRPLLAFFILLVESFALASLVGSEIHQRTVSAMLVTPARTGHVLAAKGITGTTLAFAQAVVMLLAVRAFGANPAGLLVAVLLGSIMSAGVGMIAGSAGRDFMSTLFLGMVFMIALAIPAFALMFPGSASVWVKLIPSYGIIQAIFSFSSGAGAWSAAIPDLLVALAWCVVLFGLGLFMLKRRVEAL